jgi:IMP dehydrogenase/GMP reductase
MDSEVQGQNNMYKTDYQIEIDTKLDFNDLLIKPAITTSIISRSEITIHDENGKLPLFTAPMDTVVGNKNEDDFFNSGVNVCQPRGEKNKNKTTFKSYSLIQFVEKFIDNENPLTDFEYVLIDMANGHMTVLIDAIERAKELHGDNLIIMAGNVANSEAYIKLSEVGTNLIRVGIGAGNACLTTKQTGVGFPMATLIRECYYASLTLNTPAKIVADGGMKDYSDIIKALALGADYVMVGSIFNKCLESISPNYLYRVIPVTMKGAKYAFSLGLKVYKPFRGMSTKEVQKKWGNIILKTSEGVSKKQIVEYTIPGWVENFESYLKSAMSYCNARNLEEFKNNASFIKITDNAYKRFDK